MALYLGLLALVVLGAIVLLKARTGKRKEDDQSTAELDKPATDADAEKPASAEKASAPEVVAKPVQTKTADTPVKLAKKKAPKAPDAKRVRKTPAVKSTPEKKPAQKPIQPKAGQKKVPVKAHKGPRFTPSSPAIKKYETELHLQMIRAEKAGDETAYIEVVRQNAVYMQACTTLQKALEVKDLEKAKGSLIKIRKLIPPEFLAEHHS